VLGLDPECSHDDIRKAYHLLALKFHPDKNKGMRLLRAGFRGAGPQRALLQHAVCAHVHSPRVQTRVHSTRIWLTRETRICDAHGCTCGDTHAHTHTHSTRTHAHTHTRTHAHTHTHAGSDKAEAEKMFMKIAAAYELLAGAPLTYPSALNPEPNDLRLPVNCLCVCVLPSLTLS
jgi:hypothetical protein